LKGLFQPKAITAAMIKISTNSRFRFMSKIVRKNDQSSPLRKVGECLYRNGHGVYFAWFSVRGKQLKRSLKTSDKELARRRLAELRKVATRLHGLEDRNLRFEEVVRAWLESIQGGLKSSTYRRRVVCINQLMPFFKTIPMRSITATDIEKWKLRRGASIAARTFNKELETLNHVIRYARDVKGILLDKPAEKVRNRKTETATVEIPSKEQFGMLLAELRNEPQAVRSGAAEFAEFLAYSGLRLGEGREVRWRDVNFELNTLLVTGGETVTKNHQHRTIPLFPSLRRLLESVIKERGEISKEDRIFAIRDIRQAVGSACQRAGLPRFGHHALRHFFCSNAIEAGVDFKAIAGWLGHKDGGVLAAKTYGHLRNEHSAAMAQRMTFDAMKTESPANVVKFSGEK
jgi:integrase